MSICVERDTLSVVGPDAVKYLQGQVSNDVAGLARGGSCWAFLLEPSGKLGFLVRVRRSGDDAYELDVEAGQGAAVETRLRRFLIRTKVMMAAGTRSVDIAGDSLAGADLAGQDLVGWWGVGVHRGAPPGAAADDDAYERRRIAAVWPGPAELAEGTIPGETGIVPVAVSFTKGCYTGQELVARIDSRGNNVPKMLHRLQLTAPARPGDDIVVAGVVAGTLTSVAGFDALGFVRRTVAAPSPATINDAAATIISRGRADPSE